jgi:general transcription factor 3C polypeptide 3 (transcription factor C subunit 4)
MNSLSKGNEESNYNIARAFHQLGLVDLAVPYYQKVLNTTGDSDNSVKQESAYNLSLIYRSSGSLELANQILKEHITI